MTDNNILILFSGGKDSLLAASTMAIPGYDVTLLSCNNGCICGEQCFSHSAKRLENHYPGQCQFAGIYNTSAIVSLLKQEYMIAPVQVLAESYPHVTANQIQCLCCQSAMWISGLAFCLTKNIHAIAAGYKKTDSFCTGMPEYLERINTIAKQAGINIKVPVWNMTDDSWERDLALTRHGFIPSIYEPRCTISYPSDRPSPEQVESLMQYFDKNILPRAENLIPHLTKILQYQPLSRTCSMVVIDYGEPTRDEKTGLY